MEESRASTIVNFAASFWSFSQDFFYWIFSSWRKYNIKKNDIVVDFGSGGRPFLRADILVDKFITGLHERPTGFLDTGAYIIQCDLANLPFKSRSIDFNYCSNVVEHLENVSMVLNEFQRVSKRGCIVCPSAMREKILSLHMHLWLVKVENGVLIFEKKKHPYTENIGDFFERLITSSKSYIWHGFERRLRNYFFINFEWDGKINFLVNNTKETEKWKIEGESEFVESNRSPIMYFRKYVYILASYIIRFLNSKKFDIKEILCCPVCKKKLDFYNNIAECTPCKKRFRSIGSRVWDFRL